MMGVGGAANGLTPPVMPVEGALRFFAGGRWTEITTLPASAGGTGVSNGGTLTVAANTTITGGGTLALGGFTLTVPATGTAGLLGTAQTWSAANIFSSTVELSTSSNGLTISKTTGTTLTVSSTDAAAISCGGGYSFANNTFSGTALVWGSAVGSIVANRASPATLGISPKLLIEQANTNTGPAIAGVADSAGRGFYFYSADYNNSDTGSAYQVNMTASGIDVYVLTSGGSASGTLNVAGTANLTLAGGVLAISKTTGTTLTVSSTDGASIRTEGGIAIKDGITAPSATSGYAKIFVDTADGDLKVIFGDGTTKTIVTDT